MLRKPKIDLKKAVELGQAAEQTKLHAKQIANDIEKRVENVNKHEKKRVNYSRPPASGENSAQIFRNCRFCAGSHRRGNCPAFGQKCNKCHRKNHFAKCCRQKVDNINNDQNNPSHDSSDDSDFRLESVIVTDSDDLPDYQEALKVDTVSSDVAAGHWSVILNSGSQDITFKIDTGAQVNVLPKHIYNTLVPRPKLKTTSTKLSAYNGSVIPVHGKCIIPMTHKGQRHHLLFIIVASDTTPIIGLATSERLNLIKRVYKVTESTIEESFSSSTILDDYPECFGEIGTLKSTYHMEIKDDVSPVAVPPRKVPFALKDRLKNELDHMEKMGIIEKVEKSTDWVNALVVVEKPNGKLRICLDPRPLNQAIKRQHYRLPTTEEIISQMTGAKVFSKLDASNGYWQIAVDDSTDLLTFGTAFGRYKFKRMPYGIHSASEIFQLEISKIIADCEGSVNSQDDIIVWGETKEIHDQRLHKVLAKIKESGLKLNQSKCLFGVTELTFLGHVMSAEGVKPDPKKIEAITAMPVPTTKVELQRFLGMVNYLGKFIPNLSDETAPLRALLRNETEFLMQKPQLDSFEKLKRLISSVPVLQFFNPNLPTRIRTDSSSVGLGAMLEQCVNGSWHPIAFASRALDKSEQNYAQIERETLSVVFGCERFHEYLYGRSFVAQNDHQPLKAVFSKSIVQCPPRIQRFFLRLQKYDFQFEYSPGKTMKVADALSRASLDRTPEIDPDEMAHHVHSIINQIPVSETKLSQLQRETKIDPVLQLLKQYTVRGWPSKANIDTAVKPYYDHRHEIVYNHDLLLKGQRIIIPTSMRREIRDLIHQGHQGIEKCKNRARQAVYWPGMNHELTVLVSQCSTCINYRNRHQKESLIPHQIPDQPWVKVGSDLFTMLTLHYTLN